MTEPGDGPTPGPRSPITSGGLTQMRGSPAQLLQVLERGESGTSLSGAPGATAIVTDTMLAGPGVASLVMKSGKALVLQSVPQLADSTHLATRGILGFGSTAEQ